MESCDQCGEEFERISQHWTRSTNCSYPEPTELQKRRLIGLFLGDGSVIQQNTGSTPEFRMGMINKRFLDWLDGEFGVLSNGVRFEETAKKAAERSKRHDWTTTVNEENYHDLYKLYLKPNPFFERLLGWYSNGDKIPDSGFRLTPETLCMWYVTDGCVYIGEGRATIGTNTPELYTDYLEDFGLEVHRTRTEQSIVLTKNASRRMLMQIGGPVPGYEYKWELWNRDRYDSLIESVH